MGRLYRRDHQTHETPPDRVLLQLCGLVIMPAHNTPINLSRIIRFTLAIIASMVAGFWIGATVDDDYIAVTLAIASIVVIATVILAPLETLEAHSLPTKKEQD